MGVGETAEADQIPHGQPQVEVVALLQNRNLAGQFGAVPRLDRPPFDSTSPSSIGASRLIMANSVLLPAPLGPISDVMRFFLMSTVTLSTAVFEPYRLETSMASNHA